MFHIAAIYSDENLLSRTVVLSKNRVSISTGLERGHRVVTVVASQMFPPSRSPTPRTFRVNRSNILYEPLLRNCLPSYTDHEQPTP